MERSGYQEAGLNDQGLIFFLPNMTWGQPPFYSHQMISQYWQANAVHITSNANSSLACPERLNRKQLKRWQPGYGVDGCPGAFSAQASDDGKTLIVRFVNMGAGPVTLDLSVKNKDGAVPASAKMHLLHSAHMTAVNTPAEPLHVSPTTLNMAPGTNFSSLAAVPVPPQSFTIIEVVF